MNWIPTTVPLEVGGMKLVGYPKGLRSFQGNCCWLPDTNRCRGAFLVNLRAEPLETLRPDFQQRWGTHMVDALLLPAAVANTQRPYVLVIDRRISKEFLVPANRLCKHCMPDTVMAEAQELMKQLGVDREGDWVTLVEPCESREVVMVDPPLYPRMGV